MRGGATGRCLEIRSKVLAPATTRMDTYSVSEHAFSASRH